MRRVTNLRRKEMNNYSKFIRKKYARYMTAAYHLGAHIEPLDSRKGSERRLLSSVGVRVGRDWWDIKRLVSAFTEEYVLLKYVVFSVFIFMNRGRVYAEEQQLMEELREFLRARKFVAGLLWRTDAPVDLIMEQWLLTNYCKEDADG